MTSNRKRDKNETPEKCGNKRNQKKGTLSQNCPSTNNKVSNDASEEGWGQTVKN